MLPRASALARKYKISDDELDAMMLRLFGPIRRRQYSEPKVISAGKKEKRAPRKDVRPHRNMVIVDGYNLIFADDRLKEIADFSLEKARQELMDVLSNYVSLT